MSQSPRGWIPELQVLTAEHGEEPVRIAMQCASPYFPTTHWKQAADAIRHLLALRKLLGSWETLTAILRAITSGEAIQQSSQRRIRTLALIPGQRNQPGTVISVMSPTAGYVTLATRLPGLVTISTAGQRALVGANIQRVYELVQRTPDALRKIDGLTGDDLATLIRFCDRIGLPLGSRLDHDVLKQIHAMITSGEQ
ncbi:MAG: hypothetical protein Q7R80_04555 [bacterium]|nr:hypothetical protein [bacterium]